MPPEPLLPVSDALDRILGTLEVTPAEEVPVSAAGATGHGGAGACAQDPTAGRGLGHGRLRGAGE